MLRRVGGTHMYASGRCLRRDCSRENARELQDSVAWKSGQEQAGGARAACGFGCP